jgi:ppGpp synthetase/RelA/SpoT-type nucleotidyltranferase
MRALEGWIQDAIGQIVMNNSYRISHYAVRIKEISSLLMKIVGKMEYAKRKINSPEAEELKDKEKEKLKKWLALASYEDALDLVEDWVGCRVLTYLQDTIVDLHKMIVEHERFKLIQITLHDSGNSLSPQLDKLRGMIDPSIIEFDYRTNNNGYVGVHYIIRPCPVDKCWGENPVESGRIFGRFELQLRTLMQEAWGQIQHGVIYKGRMPDDYKKDVFNAVKDERTKAFAALARHLSACESELSNLAESLAEGKESLAEGKNNTPHQKTIF